MPPRQVFSRWSALAAILVSYGLAGGLSFAISSDLTLLPFLLPLGLTLHSLGSPAAYASCPPAALAWLILHRPLAPLPQAWPSPWAILGLSLLFGFAVLFAARQQRHHRRSRDQQRHLTSLLPLCPDCGQLLCYDGQWRSFEQLLQNPRPAGPLPQHSCSPGPSSPDGFDHPSPWR